MDLSSIPDIDIERAYPGTRANMVKSISLTAVVESTRVQLLSIVVSPKTPEGVPVAMERYAQAMGVLGEARAVTELSKLPPIRGHIQYPDLLEVQEIPLAVLSGVVDTSGVVYGDNGEPLDRRFQFQCDQLLFITEDQMLLGRDRSLPSGLVVTME